MVSYQAAPEKKRVGETSAGNSERKSIPLDATPGQRLLRFNKCERFGSWELARFAWGSIQHAAQATDRSDTIVGEAERYMSGWQPLNLETRQNPSLLRQTVTRSSTSNPELRR